MKITKLVLLGIIVNVFVMALYAGFITSLLTGFWNFIKMHETIIVCLLVANGWFIFFAVMYCKEKK